MCDFVDGKMSAKLQIENDTTEIHNELKETMKRQSEVYPSMQCLSSRKSCKRKRLKGFDFCHKHILEDKNSPFQQCSFIIKSTEERCLNPAPKVENKKTFCLIHTRDPKLKKAHDEIMRRNMKRKIAHCKAIAEAKKSSSSASLIDSQRSPIDAALPKDDYFDRFLAVEGPDSDGVYALRDNDDDRYDVSWFGENDSDAESVDSEEEDPLRHAGVWTLEEALKTCRDKMIRKRSLFLEQYKRLHVLLKKRRQCHLMRMATAAYHHEFNDTNSSQCSEQRAFALYQHLNGAELLLDRKAREKRFNSNAALKAIPHNRCNYLESTDRCENQVLPLSKFCLHHILSDPDQQLYKRCSFDTVDSKSYCSTPVLQVYRSTTCGLHAARLPRFNCESLHNTINPIDSWKSGLQDFCSETKFECDAIQSEDENKHTGQPQEKVMETWEFPTTSNHSSVMQRRQKFFQSTSCNGNNSKDPTVEKKRFISMPGSIETSCKVPGTFTRSPCELQESVASSEHGRPQSLSSGILNTFGDVSESKDAPINDIHSLTEVNN